MADFVGLNFRVAPELKDELSEMSAFLTYDERENVPVSEVTRRAIVAGLPILQARRSSGFVDYSIVDDSLRLGELAKRLVGIGFEKMQAELLESGRQVLQEMKG